MNRHILTAVACLTLAVSAFAQERPVRTVYVQEPEAPQDSITEYRSNSLHYSLATNLYDWANLGTMSLEGSMSVMRHFTLNAGARYNPWSFGQDDSPNALQNRRRTGYVGARYWPWNVYSGFWMSLRGQYEEYNRGGLFHNPLTEEGDAFGISFGLGYSRMLHKNWNIDLGAFVWGGKTYYTEYASPRCGKCILDSGVKPFARFDTVYIAFAYIFN